jgi:flagellar basal-body rod modification protein FlgD
MTTTSATIDALSAMNKTTGTPTSSTTKPAPADPLANKETFLQLLVAQIKNQNPLSPQDGVQFLSQLAQFTDLEQSLGMRQDIAAIKDLLANANSSATPSA